jgi:hypothetical protein
LPFQLHTMANCAPGLIDLRALLEHRNVIRAKQPGRS